MTEDEVFPPRFQEALAHALVDVFSHVWPDHCGDLASAQHEVRRVVFHYTPQVGKPAADGWPHPDVWEQVVRRMPDGDRVALQRALMTHMALLTPEENGHG